MEANSEQNASNEAGTELRQARLQTIAAYFLVVVWGLSALSSLLSSDWISLAIRSGAALLAVGLLRWRLALRWPLFVVSFTPVPLLLVMTSYFLDVLSPKLLTCAILVPLGHGLLLFGKVSVPRLAAGTVTLLSYVVAFPFLLHQSSVPPEVCQRRVDQLSRRLQQQLANPASPIPPLPLSLPTASSGEPIQTPDGVLAVLSTGVRFFSRLPGDPNVGQEQLRSRISALRSELRGDHPTVYLAAAKDRRVKDLVPLFQTVRGARVLILASSDHVHLNPPPGAESAAERLAAAQEPGQMAAILSDELSRRAGPCATLAKGLVQLNSASADRRPQLLAAALDSGLRACNCSSVDVDALEYVVMRLLGVPPVEYVALLVASDESGQVRIPKDPQMTVQDWIRQL